MGRKVTEESSRRREADCGRVKFLLDNWWNGNQSRMASDLEVSQSLISKIVRGSQGPGRDLLDILARQRGVNAAWVLRGEGEPLQLPTKGSLPIALGILPGWPERSPELLTGERHPVAEAHDRTSRYWFKVEAGCPAMLATNLALLPGDLLMFDANTALWLDRLDQLVGRLFGLRLRRGQHLSYVLALLRKDEVGLLFDLFGEIVRQAVIRTPSKLDKKPAKEAVHARHERLPRKITRLKPVSDEDVVKPPEKASQAEPDTTATPNTETLEFTPDDVVAMRVYTVRP